MLDAGQQIKIFHWKLSHTFFSFNITSASQFIDKSLSWYGLFFSMGTCYFTNLSMSDKLNFSNSGV